MSHLALNESTIRELFKTFFKISLASLIKSGEAKMYENFVSPPLAFGHLWIEKSEKNQKDGFLRVQEQQMPLKPKFIQLYQKWPIFMISRFPL